MSKYSEVIGSFIRRGDYPLEADYIFASETALKEFYSDPVQYATLHKGLLKVVEDDGTGNQALYWVTKKQTNDNLEFTKLINGDFIKSLAPQIEQIIKDLEIEVKERQNGDSALWGTINPTTIPENLNSILDLSNAIQEIKEELSNQGVGQLDGLVQEAYYDSDKESLVMVFMMQDGKSQKLQIPLTNLIREWEPYNGHPNKVVELYKEEVYSGGADKLSADVRISTRTDNILEKDGNTLLVRGVTENIDHNGTALNIIIKRLQKRIAALEKIIEEGDFGGGGSTIPLQILSFYPSNQQDKYELGTSVTLNWIYNIDSQTNSSIDSQTINNTPIANNLRSYTITGTSSNVIVTLNASCKGYTATKDLNLNFVPRIYYGPNPSESLVNAKDLPFSHLGEIDKANFNCVGGQYAYIAVPSEYKDSVKFIIDGLEIKAYTTTLINIVNSDNKTIEYTLFKLGNKYFGNFDMDIKLK